MTTAFLTNDSIISIQNKVRYQAFKNLDCVFHVQPYFAGLTDKRIIGASFIASSGIRQPYTVERLKAAGYKVINENERVLTVIF